MTTLTDSLIALAVIAYIVSKQVRWTPVDIGRLWRLPLVLGIAGLASLSGHLARVTTADIAILVVSALLAIASGVAMGRLATFRPSPSAAGVTESRLGWIGAALWLGLIVARIGLDVLGAHLGAALATSVGVILLMLALNRAARTLVYAARLDRRAVPAR